MTTIQVTAETLWAAVRKRLAEQLPPALFDTWYADMRPRSLVDGQLELGVASRFIRQAVLGQGGVDMIESLAREHGGTTVKVKLAVDGSLFRKLHQDADAVLADLPSRPGENPRPTDASPLVVAGHAAVAPCPPPPALDPALRFDAFAAASENRLALAAARHAAEQPGKYPLLILHGRPGTGKTHLLHALCHEFHLRRPTARIACVTAREWVDEYADALFNKRLEAFRRRYRECDLLAVDEMQAMTEGDKRATKDEFTVLLDVLARAGRQVVLVANRPPAEWPNLSDAMRSRLAGGLVAGLDMPGGAERTGLARRKASERGLALPPEVAQVLAGGCEDVRALEGAVMRLSALVALGGASLNIAAARLALRGDGRTETRRLWTIDDVAKAVAEEFGVKLADMRGLKRQKTLGMARAAAVGLARTLSGASLTELGQYFGGRAHSTIAPLIKKRAPEAAREHRFRLEQVLIRLGVDRRLDELLPDQGNLFNDRDGGVAED